MCFKDQNTFEWANPFFYNLTGFAEQECPAITELFPDEGERGKIYEVFASEIPKTKEFDCKILKSSKDNFSAQITGIMVSDDSGKRFIFLIQDISEKQAFTKVFESSFDNFIKTSVNLDEAMRRIKEQKQVLQDYKTKMTDDMKLAKGVQQAIIPESFLSSRNISMWGVSRPSEQIGGDYIDYFYIDKEHTGLLLADVSGHGIASALITTMLKAYFEGSAKNEKSSAKVLKQINIKLIPILKDTGFYLTAFYAVFNTKTNCVTFSSAAHDSALCFLSDQEEPLELGKDNNSTIIGIFRDAQYTEETVQLTSSCRLILYSDGIVEARNEHGDFYGKEQFIKTLQSFKFQNPKSTINGIFKDIESFCGAKKPNDDRSILVFDTIHSGKNSENEIKFLDVKSDIKIKSFASALVKLNKINKSKENESVFNYLCAQVYFGLKDYKNAYEHCLMVLSSKNLNFQTYYLMGLIEYYLKHIDQAEMCWKKVKELAGNYKKVESYLKICSKWKSNKQR